MKEFIKKYPLQMIIIALSLLGIAWYIKKQSTDYTGIEGLAKCLKDKGAKFYGASWCPHCNAQKEMFGDAAKLLPYIECSDASGAKNKACTDAKVTGYPTWIFADGKRVSGEVSIEQLRAYAKCQK